MGQEQKATNKVKKVLFDNENKLLKKSDAGSYYDQDDWLEKYTERVL